MLFTAFEAAVRHLVAVILLLLAYLLLWPVPVDPVVWEAPEAPALEGRFAVNDRLAEVRRLGEGVGDGPEDVAVDAEGRIYVGYDDGRIVRFDAAGERPEVFAETGGRPLGLSFDGEGNLVVADGYAGLLRVSPDGAVEVLATEAEGVRFGFTDDVDVAEDGAIYFTDASSKFGPAMKARDDILEHGGHGRLLRYDPASKTTTVLLRGLQFANGVAVAPDQRSVFVTQTGNYDIVRYWIAGDGAGRHETFFANLPGIPDGISSNGRDTLWLALFAPRNAFLDAMSRFPLLRKIVFRLPRWLQPEPAAHAFVLGLSLEGEVVHNLQHASAESFHPITSVEEVNGKLYLGSLTQPAFAVLDAPR
jgi:sugar lactone lactonase YvrE